MGDIDMIYFGDVETNQRVSQTFFPGLSFPCCTCSTCVLRYDSMLDMKR